MDIVQIGTVVQSVFAFFYRMEVERSSYRVAETTAGLVMPLFNGSQIFPIAVIYTVDTGHVTYGSTRFTRLVWHYFSIVMGKQIDKAISFLIPTLEV
ncbi:hypothetical protein D3C85_1372380 [compost metagenome]